MKAKISVYRKKVIIEFKKATIFVSQKLMIKKIA